MAKRVGIVALLSACTVLMSGLGPAAHFSARADDFEAAIFNGIKQLRQSCGVIGNDPHLTAAALRHANDLVKNGVQSGHTGSDGSSPQARMVDAGFTKPGYTGEIIYWGTGFHADPKAALDMWMQSPPHRSIILDCAYTAAGFAVAWNGNEMISVGDFAGAS